MNRYQLRKARMIASVLLLAAAKSEAVSLSQLGELAARMSEAQWITVSLQAGVSVADKPCRAAVVAILLNLA